MVTLDRQSFGEFIKVILDDLFDTAALETNPLIEKVLLPPPPTFRGSRGEYARSRILEAIEHLRPPRGEPNLASPEWRPYLILSGRYVEGVSLTELAERLAISPRQLRRDHHKALDALINLCWELENAGQPQHPAEHLAEPPSFELSNELLDLVETLKGVQTLLAGKLADAGIDVTIGGLERLLVISDRIVLRQIFLNMLNAASGFSGGKELYVDVQREETGRAVINLRVPVNPDWQMGSLAEECDTASMNYWLQAIQASLESELFTYPTGKVFNWRVLLPLAQQKVILVVDDQEAAITMFRRYLTQTGYHLVGATSADQALSLAEALNPQVITLDVMMPGQDGWELLQRLRLNSHTRHIPILVCSAWADRDLSLSLGAAGFLKKPITQRMLLDALMQLDHPAEVR